MPLLRSRLMWFLADVIGLLSANVVPFSFNVVPDAWIFSTNLVPEIRCNRFLRFMLSGRYTYSTQSNLAVGTTLSWNEAQVGG